MRLSCCPNAALYLQHVGLRYHFDVLSKTNRHHYLFSLNMLNQTHGNASVAIGKTGLVFCYVFWLSCTALGFELSFGCGVKEPDRPPPKTINSLCGFCRGVRGLPHVAENVPIWQKNSSKVPAMSRCATSTCASAAPGILEAAAAPALHVASSLYVMQLQCVKTPDLLHTDTNCTGCC